MNRARLTKVVVVALLALAVAGVLAVRQQRRPAAVGMGAPLASVPLPKQDASAVTVGLPRLVDVGSTKCQACKRMETVLAELRARYPGKLSVEFYDVFEQPEAGDLYKVSIIPTQILYAADGRELMRHEGFISTDDILAAFKRNGVQL